MALGVVGHTLCGGTWVVKWEQRTERSVEVQIKLQHIVLVSHDVRIRRRMSLAVQITLTAQICNGASVSTHRLFAASLDAAVLHSVSLALGCMCQRAEHECLYHISFCAHSPRITE